MKYRAFIIFPLLLFLYYVLTRVEQNKTLLLVKRENQYTQRREHKIKEAINLLRVPNTSAEQRYAIDQRLFDKFKACVSDSAVHYVKQNIRIAEELQKPDLQNGSHLSLASLYIISGNYLDAADLLKAIDKNQPQQSQLTQYCSCHLNLYNSYAFSSPNTRTYIAKGNTYRDLLLDLVDKDTIHYVFLYAGVFSDAGRYNEAEKLLPDRFALMRTNEHEKTILGYVLGTLYKKKENVPRQIEHFAISASCNIRDAIKENTSMLGLASALFQLGEVKNAYTYIESVMEDATFCNAQLRSDEVMKIFPIIEEAYQERIHNQNTKLHNALLLVGLFAVFLIITVVLATRQMKRITKTREELYHKNQDLEQLSEHLCEVVTRLNESNGVRETYTSEFFNLYSVYIIRLEKYQKMPAKKAKDHNWEGFNKVLRSTEMIEQELKEFYKLFDDIFFYLFPNSITEFNALLAEEERFDLKFHKMSPELRIFAPIRLGITDSSRIATFLHYSTNTIYSYRTWVRNKTTVPREPFEEMVMKVDKR